MRATLFGLPASHPTLAAELMLRHKGIDYHRIDFFPALHRGLLRALGFSGITVPAVRIRCCTSCTPLRRRRRFRWCGSHKTRRRVSSASSIWARSE